MHSKNAEAIVVPLINKLTVCIQLHFDAEENILKANKYPLIKTQIKQHAYFVSELELLKNSYMDKTQTAQNMLLFLRDFLLHHILTEDLKYAEYI